jgi:hypothetical protein
MKLTLNDKKIFMGFYTLEHNRLNKQEKLQILEFIQNANAPQIEYLMVTGKMVAEGGTPLKSYLSKDNPHRLHNAVGLGIEAAISMALIAFAGVISVGAGLAGYVGARELVKAIKEKVHEFFSNSDLAQKMYDKGYTAGHAKGFDVGKEFGEHEGIKKGAEIAVSAMFVATMVAFIVHKIYKAKLSKAGQACSKFKGLEKESCMNRYEKDAIKERIQSLEKGMAVCEKISKTPNICKRELSDKIRKYKAKLGEL